MTQDRTVTNIFVAIMLTTFISGFSMAREIPDTKAQDIQVVVPTPTEEPKLITVVQENDLDTVEGYIRYKFGEHADKAFLLLQGKECAENRSLNPKAVNDNTTWGGVGRDRGIFQINSVFHPLTDEQAFDWKQNIDYAFRMFANDNYSFKRWTCGKFYGI